MSRRVLVAGGSGMAGRALVAALASRGGNPRATHHAQADGLPEGAEWVRADLRSRADCRRALAGCEAAIMAAAVTGGSAASQAAPWNQVTDNLVMGAEFLHACHEEGVGRVVMIGSATCYPPGEESLREDGLDWNLDPFPAHFGIGWVSRSLEKLARFWHDKTGMEVVSVRAANIFGPYAKFDPATSNFLPALIRKAVERLDPFEVWGSPNVVRDVISSADFAADCLALLDVPVPCGVFNIGSGRGITVEEAVGWCLRHAGHAPSRVAYGNPAAPATQARVLDRAKLEELIGKQPRQGVEQGIRETVAWYQQHHATWKR